MGWMGVDATVEAPPSLLPQKRYCDVTGLEVRISSLPHMQQVLTVSCTSAGSLPGSKVDVEVPQRRSVRCDQVLPARCYPVVPSPPR